MLSFTTGTEERVRWVSLLVQGVGQQLVCKEAGGRTDPLHPVARVLGHALGLHVGQDLVCDDGENGFELLSGSLGGHCVLLLG